MAVERVEDALVELEELVDPEVGQPAASGRVA